MPLRYTKRLVEKSVRRWGDTWVIGLIHELRQIGAVLNDVVLVEVQDKTILIRKKKL
jgi:hypothetical protein